jgi:imidazolonepropionase-like amidohydrolase
LFREFQLMKEAGLKPMQILQCATVNAAMMVGTPGSEAHPATTELQVGSIAPGKFADLVILNSNPLEDISHASDISSVMKNGVEYPADAILSNSSTSR